MKVMTCLHHFLCHTKLKLGKGVACIFNCQFFIQDKWIGLFIIFAMSMSGLEVNVSMMMTAMMKVSPGLIVVIKTLLNCKKLF